MEKICIKCKIIKKIEEFGIRRDSKDGLRNECKSCRKKISNKYYSNNKDIIDKRNKNWKLKNSDKNKKTNKEYSKKWKENNPNYRKEYDNNRIKNDLIFRLKKNIRCAVYNSLTKNGYTKRSKTYEILGCSYEKLKLHIESQWQSWMNWENYGKYNGELNFGWDIDHIICLSSAKTEEELIKLFHWNNCQPLCSKVNRDIKKAS